MKNQNTLMLVASIMLLTLLTTNSHAQSWLIGGNNVASGTTANDIGSTNNRNVDLITNNIVRMRIQAAGDVGIGTTSPLEKLHVAGNLQLDTNLFLNGDVYLDGDRFLSRGEFGYQNTFVGEEAGLSNSGISNTAVGFQSLYSTWGISNSAFGAGAGYANTSGERNSFFGAGAGYDNTTGGSNSFFGVSAGASNTTAYANSFFGEEAGRDNTTGTSNSFFGLQAGERNTTASYNSFFGVVSGAFNKTGYDNCFFGYTAGYWNSAGASNSYFGREAGYNADGFNNSFFGKHSGYASTNADGNTFIGRDAGDVVTIGDNNTCLGFSSDIEGTSYTNSSAIGYNSSATASNQARIGNSSVSSIGGYVGWSNISDGRFKKNVRGDVPGLEFISRLKPVTYTLDVKGINQYISTTDDVAEESANADAINQKEKIVYTGFIAQDVETAARDLGYNFSGIDAPKNENDLYGLRYAEFVVPLVKAVQELNEANEILSAGLLAENSKNEILEKRISYLESVINNQSSSSESPTNKFEIDPSTRSAILGQNIPNPFANSTLIPFQISENCKDASIIITESATGRVIRTIVISCKESNVTIDMRTFSGGTYSYSLLVDGKVVDTRQMVLSE